MQAELKIAGLDEIFDRKIDEAIERIERAYKPVVNELIEIKELIKSKFGFGDEAYLNKKQVIEIIGKGGKNGAYLNQLVAEKKFPNPDRYESNKFPIWRVKTIKKYLQERNEFWRWEEWEKRKIKENLK